MPRERWRFDRTTGAEILVESFGDPIPEHDIAAISTLTMRTISVISDIETYKSPIDGSTVRSRSEHRDHMRRHRVIEIGNEKIQPNTPPQRPPVRDAMQKAISMIKQGYRPRLEVAD